MALSSRSVTIELRRVCKSFRNWDARPFSIKEFLVNLSRFRSGFKRGETVQVLRDVSFSIHSGEFVGIMGPNGAGKSTILKVISGIYLPTSGTAISHGQIAPLIELGAGLHQDLSGLENIYLNGAILGFGRAAVSSKISEILEFADLGEKIHMPVRYYSNGMLARLGFSIATHLPAPILLIDEILAVGDLTFQEKCIRKINELHDQGRTIVLVSHDPKAIASYCDRCVVISAGGVFYDGPAEHAEAQYRAGLDLNLMRSPVENQD